jgi:hypothetical protein
MDQRRNVMPIRVDNSGYLIDYQGHRLSAQQGNDAASVEKRFHEVVEAWKKNNPNDTDGPDKGITTMEVEDGDCQWDIFAGSGANEYRNYNTVNKHISDPDLIHKGDIIFVDKTTHLSQFRNGRDAGKANIDLFHDQQQGAAERGATQADLDQDAGVFLATAPDEVKGGVFLDLFESPPDTGDTAEGVALNRRAAAGGYLLSLGTDAPTGFKDLRNRYYNTTPEGVASAEGYNTAITGAATDLGLLPKVVEPAAAPAPQLHPYASDVTVSPLAKIRADGENVTRSPTDQNRAVLQQDIAAYIGSIGSPDYAQRLRDVTQIDCGNGPISRELPFVAARQMGNYAEISAPGQSTYAVKVRLSIVSLLQALPPSERQKAVDTLMSYDFKNKEWMNKQIKDMATSDAFGFDYDV